MRATVAVLTLFTLIAAGCDRRTEPFVPDEKPKAPDLAKIFPAGAERAAEPAALPDLPGRVASPATAPVRPIEGTIELAPDLVGSVPPGAVLFLMARSVEGGASLAVQRIADPQFPLHFSIGPGEHAVQGAPFAGPIRIAARIDADGNATSLSTGDLLGESAETYRPGDRGASVVISQIHPVDPETAVSEAQPVDPATADSAPADSLSIEGTIRLAPDLANEVPAGAVLFLIARTTERGPPLAVVRVADPKFPFPFSIGPDDQMVESMPFAGEIRINVRLDSDGDAASRSPGDLQGAVETPHTPGDRGVVLVIDEVL
jgi:hypothetical protein